jgi:hypothetical protein
MATMPRSPTGYSNTATRSVSSAMSSTIDFFRQVSESLRQKTTSRVDRWAVPHVRIRRSAAVPRPFWLSPPELPRGYDITPHGRFLARVSLDEPRSEEMPVVLNWFEELVARLPRSR